MVNYRWLQDWELGGNKGREDFFFFLNTYPQAKFQIVCLYFFLWIHLKLFNFKNRKAPQCSHKARCSVWVIGSRKLWLLASCSLFIIFDFGSRNQTTGSFWRAVTENTNQPAKSPGHPSSTFCKTRGQKNKISLQCLLGFSTFSQWVPSLQDNVQSTYLP